MARTSGPRSEQAPRRTTMADHYDPLAFRMLRVDSRLQVTRDESWPSHAHIQHQRDYDCDNYESNGQDRVEFVDQGGRGDHVSPTIGMDGVEVGTAAKLMLRDFRFRVEPVATGIPDPRPMPVADASA